VRQADDVNLPPHVTRRQDYELLTFPGDPATDTYGAQDGSTYTKKFKKDRFSACLLVEPDLGSLCVGF
jgi:hypothetical protein